MGDPTSVRFKDRQFTASELKLIREVVAACGGLSRQELANTTCELLGWRRPNGGLKTWECQELLARLESAGLIALPARRPGRPRGSRTSVPRTGRGEIQERITGTVHEVAPVRLQQVASDADRRLWRAWVGRYHYLGHRVPCGAHRRSLVEIARPQPTLVGGLQLSSPAWRIAVRDRWIGWTDDARRRHLQQVVNNSRVLLLPWVEVRQLASHVLARRVRQLRQDWPRAYGVRPLLVESLVEAGRHAGACYRAATWIELGPSAGRGRMDRQHQRHGASPKRVFVYPLVRDAPARLRGGR
jgi:Druantia protein DruA